MIRVKNRRAIANLSRKSLKANRARNLVAVAAIALTTLLFTALFTITLSVNDAFQQANFRQCGGWSHGTFKYLSEEQFDTLKTDPDIRAWGLRRFLGMAQAAPFNKSHVEIGYSDANNAHWMYCDPVEGRLPLEGSDEAATDTRVLELLGITPELGARFSLTFEVDGVQTTQSFTLCGWWTYDEAIIANHVLLPESRVNAVLDEVGVEALANDSQAGSWNLDVMFSNAWNIAGKMEGVLLRHGYQSESRSAGDNYIGTGVNWGYTGSQLTDSLDAQTGTAVAAVLTLIVVTGYLIIYNVFQISVAGDIRFYGLLKTIGTTPRQLRRIIRRQAHTLAAAGIPLGLLSGWLVGAALAPVLLAQLNGVQSDTVSLNPLIFVLSALFSLATVLLSCLRPGRLAGRVSPVDAARYTEGDGKRKTKRGARGASLRAMALANLGRNRGKTAVTVLSLALAVVLLNVTVTFAGGFDMDKFIAQHCVSDFVLADAAYFQTGGEVFGEDTALPASAIDAVTSQGGVSAGGRVYGRTTPVQETVDEAHYRQKWSRWNDDRTLDATLAWREHTPDGKLLDTAQLYGMEQFALDRLRLLEGDLSTLNAPGTHNIAAVYRTDDYGSPEWNTHWAKLGDKIKLRYVEEFEYYNPETGEIYGDWSNIPEDSLWAERSVKFREVEYTVTALVSVPSALSYRYSGDDEFVMGDQTFLRDTGSASVMLYAFNTAAEANDAMESFLRDYTQQDNARCDFESKAVYAAQFESVRAMFLLLGGALSAIVGLVGILNFFNAVLTGILTRRREFAMLQSIGMSGKQLKTMLVWEGLLYAVGSLLLALVLTVATGPLLAAALESLYWFFTYRFTAAPILLLLPVFLALGVALPLGSYRSVARLTIVERLREAE